MSWSVLALALAASPSHSVTTFKEAPLPPSGVTAAEHPRAPYVILEDRGEVDFLDKKDPGAGYVFTQYFRVKVLSPLGRLRARTSMHIDGFSTVDEIAGRSYADADGQRDLAEVTAVATVEQAAANPMSAMFGDDRVVVFDVPRVAVGDIIETRVRTTTRGIAPRFRWFIDNDVPVALSHFVVRMPQGWTLDHRLTRDDHAVDGGPTCAALEDGRQRCELRMTDLPPLEREPHGPSIERRQLRLTWAVHAGDKGWATWEDVGRWYGALRATLDPMPAERVAQLVASAASVPAPTEEARLFLWVRDNIRYVYRHSGLGAYRPHAADEVTTNGWGDCKDSTELLVVLLRARGIAAHPALVSATLEPMRELPPTPGAFNHVIVAIEDGTSFRYLDPVDKYNPPGVIGSHLRGRRVLVVKPDAVVDTEIPWSSPGDRHRVTWDVDASGALRVVVEAGGAWATGWRVAAERSPRDVERRVLGLLADDRDAEVKTASVTVVDATNVRVEAELAAPALTIAAGPRVVRVLGALLGSSGEVRLTERRESPIELGLPMLLEEQIRIARPPGAKLVHLPAPRRQAIDGFTLDVTARETGELIEVTRRREVTRHRLAPESAAGYAAIAAAVHQSAVDAVVFEVAR